MVSNQPGYSEEQLAELIGVLKPAPTGWVEAAQTLPAARAALDQIVERALADARLREQVLEDLESALRQAGIEPRRELLEEARQRLGPGAGLP